MKKSQKDLINSARKEAPKEKTFSFKSDSDKAEVSAIVEKQIKTLAELIEACKIDTNEWEIERYICNKWEMAYKIGKHGEGGHQTVPLWQVKAWLKKNRPVIDLNEFKSEIITAIKKHKPSYKNVTYKKDTNPYLYELAPVDVHYGKHAWGKETGHDYDIEIAEKDLMYCVDEHIKKMIAFKVERILLIVGNDFYNVDNKLNTTSAGTPQQEDTRWKKTFTKGRELHIKIIDKLRLIAHVDVLIIPGNHDLERSYFLGDSLECWYHTVKNVNIDNSASNRKYYNYGKCLIGLTHGKDEKIPDLPTIMAIEQPELFGATFFREWHLGDKHHQKRIDTISIDENKGVTTRILRSISPADQWHHSKGYIGSLRSIDGFLWHKETGMAAHFMTNIKV